MNSFSKHFTYRHFLILLAFYSFCALASAYIAHFFFGHQPCVLCLYQRVPFFAVVLIAAVAVVLIKTDKANKIALRICLVILLINAGIASYHVGVEQKIFAGPTTCVSNDLGEINDLEELRKSVAATKAVRCDVPSLVFLGLSMAAWNMLYCLFLVVATLCLLTTQKINNRNNEI